MLWLRAIVSCVGALVRSRFLLLFSMALLALTSFFITRIILVFNLPELHFSFIDVLLAMLVGLVYDIGFIAYALGLLALYVALVPNRVWQSTFNKIFIHVLVFASIYVLWFIGVAEWLFWDEFGARFNFIAIDYLANKREVFDNIKESYPLGGLLSAMFVFSTIIYLVIRRSVRRSLSFHAPLSTRFQLGSLFLIAPIVIFLCLGQGARQISNNVYVNELGSNGPYQFFAALRNNQIDYGQFYVSLDDKLISKTLKSEVIQPDARFINDDLYSIRREVVNTGPEKRLNIMLIMVESLSGDFMQHFGNEAGLTPNLDKLADNSLFFTQFYSTGTRTDRGLEAVTLSIPPTPGRSIVKRIGKEKNMWSLGNVLRKKGYDARFIYGGRGYFDNMNEFFSGNGYEIVDQSRVANNEIGFENAWGMADEFTFTQAIKQADISYKADRPFFHHIMTTSNHRPYTYPDRRIDIPSGHGRNGAVKYTDWAINNFIERAKYKPWFADTIFVIVADHCARSEGKVRLPLNRYHIPLIIYSPKHIAAAKVDKVASQIDVAPTLLALLGMSYESNFFGKNILTMTPAEERALVGSYQYLGLYQHGKMSILGPKKIVMQQEDALSEDPIVTKPADDDPLLLENIAFYQGASFIYRNKLNAWPVDDALKAKPSTH
ncbi:MAG: sulfatase-like hydrolase/transferase [Gammaproteobacteria bacterium]|nr:sulfatase-like hydrolase/transferase [Gammaproteobacteria bacterium]